LPCILVAGLAGSPAIAVEVCRLLFAAGLGQSQNPLFNPNRAPIITPKDGWKGLSATGKATDPKSNVICKCEKVTEAEIVTALRRSLPIDSTQAIRKRTRAGMGYCQADADNFNCECKVAEIIARETNLPIEVLTWVIAKHCPGAQSRMHVRVGCADLSIRFEASPFVQAVGRRPWPGTTTLPQRWLSEQDKTKLADIMNGK
jgi:glycerol-3-phosphate dehydrogenase